jgi:hypothetical protein
LESQSSGSKDVILDDDQRDQIKLHLYLVLAADDPIREQLRPAALRAADKRRITL